MSAERPPLRALPGGRKTTAEPPWAVHGSPEGVKLWVGGTRVRLAPEQVHRLAAALLVAAEVR